MEAIEIEAEIDENNEIHIKLPEPHGPGHARVIVLVESQQPKPAALRKHKPSPLLANKGAELHGDDIAPAFSEQEWGDLYQ
jgi:hypothetical protein